MAETKPEQDMPPFDWYVWFQWVLATTLGWGAGWLLTGDIGLGTTIGIAQWFVLRQFISQAGWWILATAAGWVAGWALIVAGIVVPPGGGIINSMAAGGVIGAIVGIGQWVVLRWQFTRLAGWWVMASTVGWAVALTGILGGSLAGTVAGAMTGLMLEYLLRFSRLKT